ncbi:MAG: iron-sulfur cluster assembly accessory protein [Rickettsiaceae bacterium]|nr:iron-sulfur cluster assembly accessory protein [Rickettsiaceae bacterium]
MTDKTLMTITNLAAEKVKELLAQRGEDSIGIKVKIKSGGCSGYTYVVEYADNIGKYDKEITDKGVKIVIDPMAVMHLIGTQMDYFEDQFKSGFVFSNPNEKGKCGCGKSFAM